MALKVETIDKQKRIPQEAIQDVVEQIKTKFKPEKIILFGSYAYGTFRSDSDVDLLVVMNTELKPSEQALRILKSIEVQFGLDLIVRTPIELQRRIRLGDFFLREAVRKGKVLHESVSSGMD